VRHINLSNLIFKSALSDESTMVTGNNTFAYCDMPYLLDLNLSGADFGSMLDTITGYNFTAYFTFLGCTMPNMTSLNLDNTNFSGSYDDYTSCYYTAAETFVDCDMQSLKTLDLHSTIFATNVTGEKTGNCTFSHTNLSSLKDLYLPDNQPGQT
jgi:hypothetical protein